MAEKEIKVKAYGDWKVLLLGSIPCESVLYERLNHVTAGNQEARLHRIGRNGGTGVPSSSCSSGFYLCVRRWQQHASDSDPPLNCKNTLIRTVWHLPKQDFQWDPVCFTSSGSFLKHLQRC
ncbi:hypothetical protein R6Z07F_000262 [Ovis aries]